MKKIFTIICFCFLYMSVSAQHKIGDILTEADGSEGIIFWLFPEGGGGWMVNVKSSGKAQWGDKETLLQDTLSAKTSHTCDIKAIWDTAGYAYTKQIRELQNNPNYAAGKVDFDNAWYLPAIGQLRKLFAVFSTVQKKLKTYGKDTLEQEIYWSSTESGMYSPNGAPSYGAAWTTTMISFGNTAYGYGRKYENYLVRSVKTFVTRVEIYTPDTSLNYLWNTGDTLPQIERQPRVDTLYQVKATTTYGCSAEASQYIWVNPTEPKKIFDTLCQGDSYKANGFEISSNQTQSPGIFKKDSVLGEVPCQLHLSLSLWIKPHSMGYVAASYCEGQSFRHNGVTYVSPGIYTQTMMAANGCDSILTIEVQENKGVYTEIREKAVNHFQWNDLYYYESGTYEQKFSSVGGCDSTVRLYLSLEKMVSLPFKKTLCEKELPYRVYDSVFHKDGYYEWIAKNSLGNPIYVQLGLSINPNDTTFIRIDTCEEDMPILYLDSVLKSAGEYYFSYTNQEGCDSLVQVKLHTYACTTPYTLRIEAGKGGSVSPAGDTIVRGGRSIEIYIKADSCYKLKSILLDGRPQPLPTDGIFRLSNIDTNHLIRVLFSSSSPIKITNVEADILCGAGPYSIRYTYENGSPTHSYIHFSYASQTQGFLDSLHVAVFSGKETAHYLTSFKPSVNTYEGDFSLSDESGCASDPWTFQVEVRYPVEDVVRQKWNDAIAVRNDQYNGGYTFTAFQWYQDQLELKGEKDFRLYQAKGLTMTSVYEVLLTRDDQTQFLSCPIIPQLREVQQTQAYPNPQKQGNAFTVRVEKGDEIKAAYLYNSQGKRVSLIRLQEGENIISVFLSADLYLLQILRNNGESETLKINIIK